MKIRAGAVLASLLYAAVLPAAEPAAQALPKVRVANGKELVADGKQFIPFGVNYFRPHSGWAPQLWKQFDAEATRRDLQLLKKMGANCVRVFLSYGSFYSEPGTLSPEGMAKLDQFLAMAEQAGIYVHPTGPDHWEGTPQWARTDRIADDTVLATLETFWRELAGRYRKRNVLFAYDLLNEPAVGWESAAMRAKWNVWVKREYGSAEKAAQAWGMATETVSLTNAPVPPPKDAPGNRHLLDYQRFRESLADEWTRRQAAAIKAADPDALVTVGLIQWSVPALLPGVQHYAAFRPERQAKYLDFMEVHFYPLDHGFYAYASAESEQRNLAYLESIVREVARPGLPVVLAEFGWYGGGKLTIDQGKHPPATEEQQAQWCRRAIEKTQPSAKGWLNWGFYDHPEARDVTQLTGLLTADGKEKAWGRVFRELAARPLTENWGKASANPTLDWDTCVTSTKAGHEFRERYFRATSTP